MLATREREQVRLRVSGSGREDRVTSFQRTVATSSIAADTDI